MCFEYINGQKKMNGRDLVVVGYKPRRFACESWHDRPNAR